MYFSLLLPLANACILIEYTYFCSFSMVPEYLPDTVAIVMLFSHFFPSWQHIPDIEVLKTVCGGLGAH